MGNGEHEQNVVVRQATIQNRAEEDEGCVVVEHLDVEADRGHPPSDFTRRGEN